MFLGGDINAAKKFWSDMRGTPRFARHPARTRADRDRIIPVSFHGDGVTVSGVGRSWSKSADAFSWTSLLSAGSTKLFSFLIYISFAGAECFVGDRNSMRVFLERATMVSLLAVAGAMAYTRFQKSSNCWRSAGGACWRRWRIQPYTHFRFGLHRCGTPPQLQLS